MPSGAVGTDGYPVGRPAAPGTGGYPVGSPAAPGPGTRRSWRRGSPAAALVLGPVKRAPGRMAWCPSTAGPARSTGTRHRHGAQARERPGRRRTVPRARQGIGVSARGKRHPEGRRAAGPGNDARERRPTEMVPGRQRSWFRHRRPSAIGTRNGDGVFPICGALRPLSCGCPSPGANGAGTGTPS